MRKIHIGVRMSFRDSDLLFFVFDFFRLIIQGEFKCRGLIVVEGDAVDDRAQLSWSLYTRRRRNIFAFQSTKNAKLCLITAHSNGDYCSCSCRYDEDGDGNG